jgi:2-polyprenyl-3-methyl-5-hydroxy-6-metoxy-1,4-benzoquinol methylase
MQAPKNGGCSVVERYTRAAWETQYSQIEDWDAMFRLGQWDYLTTVSELPRYALIAGYIHKFKGNGAVLDAGCGEGVLIDYLDAGRISYSGFDISETAITRARKRSSEARLSICSVDDYDTDGTNTYDVIVFNEVLPHVSDPITTLDRFIRILNPGGLAILSLYQNIDERANARILTRMLEVELAAGKYTLLARATVENEREMKWSVYCLR